jgi:hypothetical protein
MTTSNLNCDDFADRLADFLERDADEATRTSMEAHALACADCGSLLADLRRLRIDAANLPELVPSRDLWAGIAERIQTPVVVLGAGAARGTLSEWNGGAKRRLAPLWLGLAAVGLAAAGLIAVTATVTHEMTKRGLQPVAATQVAAVSPAPPADTALSKTAAPITTQPVTKTASVPSVRRSAVPPAAATLVANRPSAQQTYEAEIANLRTVLKRRRPELDSATVAVVEHNLRVIDDAIAQCQAALKKDPASRFLMESLNDAMDDKVQLLRTAAVLPSKS